MHLGRVGGALRFLPKQCPFTRRRNAICTQRRTRAFTYTCCVRASGGCGERDRLTMLQDCCAVHGYTHRSTYALTACYINHPYMAVVCVCMSAGGAQHDSNCVCKQFVLSPSRYNGSQHVALGRRLARATRGRPAVNVTRGTLFATWGRARRWLKPCVFRAQRRRLDVRPVAGRRVRWRVLLSHWRRGRHSWTSSSRRPAGH